MDREKNNKNHKNDIDSLDEVKRKNNKKFKKSFFEQEELLEDLETVDSSLANRIKRDMRTQYERH